MPMAREQSSPHTRGARYPGATHWPLNGIIPAYAGSTGTAPTKGPIARDHPRIRGEHQPSDNRRRTRAGSSPHTRGARDSRRARGVVAGIIPAYAGSTRSRHSPAGRDADHPRIRGEHRRLRRASAGGGGSSPHTRGARHASLHPTIRTRIIPAYAGSTYR